MGTKNKMDALFDKALRHEQHGEWDEAIALYEQAAKKWPEQAAFARRCIAELREQQGRPAQSENNVRGEHIEAARPASPLRKPWLSYAGLFWGIYFAVFCIEETLATLLMFAGTQHSDPSHTLSRILAFGALALTFVGLVDKYLVHPGRAAESRPRLRLFGYLIPAVGLLAACVVSLIPPIYAARRAGQNAAITHAMDQGQAAVSKGDYPTAIANYSEAIQLDPKLATAYVNRGSAYLHNGTWDSAIADLSEAIRLDPEDPNAYYCRGFAYGKKGDWDTAISDLSEVIRLDPKAAMAYKNRGFAYQQKGEIAKAKLDFTKAKELGGTPE